VNKKQKVLFLSIRDSVRGQMAEGFLRALAEDRFIATSGGIESDGGLDPLAVEVMAEEGIDISSQCPKERDGMVQGAFRVRDYAGGYGQGEGARVSVHAAAAALEPDGPAGDRRTARGKEIGVPQSTR